MFYRSLLKSLFSDAALFISGWRKLEKISLGESLAVDLIFFNLNLEGLLRCSFSGGGRRSKITPLYKTCYNYAKNFKFGTQVHIHM